MKKVSIHIVVGYRDKGLSPWTARLQYGDVVKVLEGDCKSLSENALKVFAIKAALKQLKERCIVDVFCEAGSFREVMRSNNLSPDLEKLKTSVSQFYFLPADDLSPIMIALKAGIANKM